MPKQNKKSLIVKAIIDLLDTTPINDISVDDILKKAGVSRSTFYRRFKDKFDLMNYLYEEQMSEIISKIPDLINWKERCYYISSYYKKNAKQYKNILVYHGQNSYYDFIFNYGVSLIRSRINRQAGEENITVKLDFAIKASAQLYTYLITQWILNDFNYTDDQLIELLEMSTMDILKPYFIKGYK